MLARTSTCMPLRHPHPVIGSSPLSLGSVLTTLHTSSLTNRKAAVPDFKVQSLDRYLKCSSINALAIFQTRIATILRRACLSLWMRCDKSGVWHIKSHACPLALLSRFVNLPDASRKAGQQLHLWKAQGLYQVFTESTSSGGLRITENGGGLRDTETVPGVKLTLSLFHAYWGAATMLSGLPPLCLTYRGEAGAITIQCTANLDDLVSWSMVIVHWAIQKWAGPPGYFLSSASMQASRLSHKIRFVAAWSQPGLSLPHASWGFHVPAGVRSLATNFEKPHRWMMFHSIQ